MCEESKNKRGDLNEERIERWRIRENDSGNWSEENWRGGKGGRRNGKWCLIIKDRI